MIPVNTPNVADPTPSPRWSIVTPAYNEAENLPLLYKLFVQALDPFDRDWEWIIVDDHSVDGTFQVAASIAATDQRIRAIRLARNVGSTTASLCGLDQATGQCAVQMPADLQYSPDVIPQLLAEWEKGAQVVWAARAQREGDNTSAQGFSKFYYFLMRRIVGIREIPVTGADLFLIDRVVIDALTQFEEKNVGLLALISWMGYRQATVTCDRLPRQHGRSGWTLEKKIKLMVDSITAFSYFPIRLMSYVGLVVAVLGFFYSLLVIGNGLAGRPPQGWSSLMVVVLVIGGIQMIMMGVLGEYLWRALDETRKRPKYLIEASTPRAHTRIGATMPGQSIQTSKGAAES
jgi:dolichol-phosphate mannosyltransferase